MSALPLRPYQSEALAAVLAAPPRGVSRPMVVLPTGAGKTVVFAHLAAQRRRSLVIAHREELLTQAAAKLHQVAPDLKIGMVKAERDEHAGADVIVASIQTLARPGRVDPLIGQVDTVIVDEAHHAAARTYRDVLAALGCMADSGGPLTVGVTATAGRGDGVGLGAVWQEIVYQRGIIQMIADGYLVDVRGLELTTDLAYDRLKTSRGDYTDASLGAQMDDSVIEAAAVGYVKYAKNRRGVAFTPTIATAHELAAELTRRGVRAEALSGQTPGEDRRAILRRLSTGDTQAVCNCAVLTEGFDEPALSCALIARPTKNRVLFTQMAGRVLRPHPTKDHALLLTLAAPPTAALATIADLAGRPPGAPVLTVRDEESLAAAVARDEEERSRTLNGRRVVTAVTAKQIDLFARSRLRWLPVGPGFMLPAGDRDIMLVPQEGDKWRVVAAHASGKWPTEIAAGLSLEWAQGVGEEQVRAGADVLARQDAAWRRRAPTDAQRAQLEKRGLEVPATRGEASDVLSAVFAGSRMARLAK